MLGCQVPVAAAVGLVQAGGRPVVASGSVAAAGGLWRRRLLLRLGPGSSAAVSAASACASIAGTSRSRSSAASVAAVGDHVLLVGEPVPAVRDGVAVGRLLVSEVGCLVALLWAASRCCARCSRSVTPRSLSCDVREPSAAEVGAVPVRS